MARKLVCFVFLFAIAWAVSRPGNTLAAGASVSLSAEYFPWTGLKDPTPGTVLETAEVAQIKGSLNASLPYGIFRSGKTILLNSLSAETIQLPYRNSVSDDGTDDHLVGAAYSLTWIEVLNPSWKSVTVFSPGAYYDGHDVTRNIFRLQGMVSFWKTMSPGLDVGLGGGYTDDFGKPKPVPVFGVNFNSFLSGEKPKPGTHVVEMVIPVSASYFYVASRDWQLGAVGKVAGGKYLLTHGAASGDSVELSDQTVGPCVRFSNDRTLLELTYAFAFKRRLQMWDSTDSKIADFDLKNATALRLTAKITF